MPGQGAAPGHHLVDQVAAGSDNHGPPLLQRGAGGTVRRERPGSLEESRCARPWRWLPVEPGSLCFGSVVRGQDSLADHRHRPLRSGGELEKPPGVLGVRRPGRDDQRLWIDRDVDLAPDARGIGAISTSRSCAGSVPRGKVSECLQVCDGHGRPAKPKLAPALDGSTRVEILLGFLRHRPVGGDHGGEKRRASLRASSFR